MASCWPPHTVLGCFFSAPLLHERVCALSRKVAAAEQGALFHYEAPRLPIMLYYKGQSIVKLAKGGTSTPPHPKSNQMHLNLKKNRRLAGLRNTTPGGAVKNIPAPGGVVNNTTPEGAVKHTCTRRGG